RDPQCQARLVPDALPGCALHMKCVFAGRQSRIARYPAITANFNPVAIQLLEFVAIAVCIWIEIRERSETQRKDVLVVSQCDIFGVADGLPKRGFGSNLSRTPCQLEIGQNQGQRVRRTDDLIWKEGNPATKPAEKHLSTYTLKASIPTRKVIARQAVNCRVVRKSICDGIEPGQPTVCAHPEHAELVFENAAHGVAGQTILHIVVGECPAFTVQLVQAVFRADPNDSRMVNIGRGNGVVAQRSGITYFVRIDGKLTCPRIETVQTSPAAHPEEPAFVLTGIGIHLVVTFRGLLVDDEALVPRVKSIKTIVGSDPHGARMIDQHPTHYVVAQTGWVVW